MRNSSSHKLMDVQILSNNFVIVGPNERFYRCAVFQQLEPGPSIGVSFEHFVVHFRL